MSEYHDQKTYATDAINIDLDFEKLKFLMPDLFTIIGRLKYKFQHLGLDSYIGRIEEHIRLGDSQGALVVDTNPLLIAAYNEDIDCVVMLRYKKEIQERYQFKVNDRLVCVNTFGQLEELQPDLIPGENNTNIWNMVHPIVADLVSSSNQIINTRKQEIGDEGYTHIRALADEYLEKNKWVSRDGRPFYASSPGS